MAYAIARMKKLKGAGVSGADRHVERRQKTPNADRAKQNENVHLIGDKTPLRELVDERIRQHGGKSRKDAVECVELMLEASPEYFTEGRDEVNPERVPPFAEKTVEFLREQYGANCVKAVLHMDEHTPHVQAFVVPIDGRGRLNCRGMFSTRECLREFQNTYARKMEPLGLKRGIERSRATHIDVQKFYTAIKERVPLELQLERIPDPPLMLATEASREKYKQKVLEAVQQQTAGQLQTLRHQAMLARNEAARREATEARALAAERRAEDRALKAERMAEERSAVTERDAQERVRQAEAKTKEWLDMFFVEQKENIAFHHQTRGLQAELAAAREQTGTLNLRVTELDQQVENLNSRLRDIPLREVMTALGYRGEAHKEAMLYRNDRGEIELLITDKAAFHHEREVASNAVDLVTHMRDTYQGEKTTPAQSVQWLADTFGKDRAMAALLVHTEQHATSLIQEHERTRDVPQREYARGHERGFSR